MSCRPARERFTNAGLGRTIRLGDSTVAALYRAGQPLSRPGRSYRYCVAGQTGAAVMTVFNGRGRTALVASTAPGDRVGGIGPGASARRLGRRAHRVMPGVWVGRRLSTGAHYVYGVRNGRVRFVAITTASQARSTTRLRSDLRAAGV
jgi:hypothetical protein